MGAIFIDLDGTIFKHGTNDPLPGAVKFLERIVEEGHQIIFTTRRGDLEFKGHPIYSEDGARTGVRSLRIPYVTILYNISSPRMVVNDDGVYAWRHQTNLEWTDEWIELALKGVSEE